LAQPKLSKIEQVAKAALLFRTRLSVLRKLDPLAGHAQPGFFVERAFRLLSLLAAFLGLLAVSSSIVVGHAPTMTWPTYRSN
jgi:hypothetical protein